MLFATTYAACVKVYRIEEVTGLANTLNRSQRPILLSMIGAYHTAQLNALSVLAGVMPKNLEINERFDLYDRRRALTEYRRYRTLAEIDIILLSEWHNRWVRSSDGQVAYTFVPDVSWRLGRGSMGLFFRLVPPWSQGF